jgi:hypothetical protein
MAHFQSSMQHSTVRANIHLPSTGKLMNHDTTTDQA